MESAQDFKSLQDNVEKALVSAVKSVNRVSNHDLGFQSLANPEVGTRIEESRTRLLKIANRLLKASAEAGRVSAPKLETFEDIETRWGDIVDVLDSNFAKTDAALDEFHAQVKKKGHAMAKQIEATVTETTTATPATVRAPTCRAPLVYILTYHGERRSTRKPRPLPSTRRCDMLPMFRSLNSSSKRRWTTFQRKLGSLSSPENLMLGCRWLRASL